jgi:hypothetical protein
VLTQSKDGGPFHETFDSRTAAATTPHCYRLNGRTASTFDLWLNDNLPSDYRDSRVRLAVLPSTVSVGRDGFLGADCPKMRTR